MPPPPPRTYQEKPQFDLATTPLGGSGKIVIHNLSSLFFEFKDVMIRKVSHHGHLHMRSYLDGWGLTRRDESKPGDVWNTYASYTIYNDGGFCLKATTAAQKKFLEVMIPWLQQWIGLHTADFRLAESLEINNEIFDKDRKLEKLNAEVYDLQKEVYELCKKEKDFL